MREAPFTRRGFFYVPVKNQGLLNPGKLVQDMTPFFRSPCSFLLSIRVQKNRLLNGFLSGQDAFKE
jgi:hypothetical protein